jgi:5-oxoprolinase (ATP-hydrolysing) subunit A
MELNLNADLGESFGAWKMGDDATLLTLVNSASLACGFHAGDPLVMRRTVHLANKAGVTIGAHPSFPDLQGFGRRPMHLPADELQAMIIYQLGALAGMAAVEGTRITHVKPHGALSNMACLDAALATHICRAVKSFDKWLILLAPAGSQLARAGEHSGLRVASEIFADRAYTDEGNLVPRTQAGAVLTNSDDCVAHVLRMLDAGGVVSVSGKHLALPIHSVCLHGDHPQATAAARAVRQALLEAGCTLKALPQLTALHT